MRRVLIGGLAAFSASLALTTAGATAAAAAAAPEAAADSSPEAIPKIGDVVDGRWQLVWSDEFNADGKPDPANWSYEQGMVRNHELQNYTTENAVAKDGVLVIEARRERSGNANYSSASIHTAGKRQFLYGRFEARLKIDTRLGSWPAFWTLGSNIGAVGWPASGEIDIMEYYRSHVLANVCRQNGSWDAVATPLEQLGGDEFAKKFHVWAMEWDWQRVDLFLDGQLVNHFDVRSADYAGGDNPFRQPQYLILNQALGGQNGGDPSNTAFPVRYEIDYVRVYQAVR